MKTRIVWFALIALLAAPAALAAKYGVIMIDGTPVVTTTAPDAVVLENLARGATVGASDQPFGGYYRVRTRNGNVGWIAADRLTLRDYPTAQQTQGAGAAAGAPFQRWLFRAIGGVRFLGLNQIATVSRFGFGPSYDFGGEFSFLPLKWLAISVRGEFLLNALAGQDQATTYQYTFMTQAVPIMGGLEFLPINNERVALRIGGYAGYAPVLTHTVDDFPVNGTLALSGPAFAALGKAELAVKFGRHFQVQLASGYRYIVSALLSPAAATGNTGLIYGTTPIAIDMSGIFIQGGIGIGF